MVEIIKCNSKSAILVICGLSMLCVSCRHAGNNKVAMFPSPNSDDRKHPISMIVLHYTAISTCEESLTRLCETTNVAGRVSAHYLVDRDGGVYNLVDESKRAWHSGIASWAGLGDINSRSIGIELVNVGLTSDGSREEYPAAQTRALIALCKDIQSRHKIRFVLGHSDVAPSRKQDPGEAFDWKLLAKNGVGIWTDSFVESSDDVLKILSDIGYDTSMPDKAVVAFQRHFYPAGLNGHDGMTQKRAAAVRAVFCRENSQS